MVLAMLFVLGVAKTSRAQVANDEFHSKPWRIRVTAPSNWKIAGEGSYPNIVLWLARRNPPGTMLLSAEELEAPLDSLSYACQSVELLAELGFDVPTQPRCQSRAASGSPQLHAATSAYIIDFDDGKRYMRQAFLVASGIGYSLTLAAPTSRARGQHLRAFDFALRSIRIDRPIPPSRAGQETTP